MGLCRFLKEWDYAVFKRMGLCKVNSSDQGKEFNDNLNMQLMIKLGVNGLSTYLIFLKIPADILLCEYNRSWPDFCVSSTGLHITERVKCADGLTIEEKRYEYTNMIQYLDILSLMKGKCHR